MVTNFLDYFQGNIEDSPNATCSVNRYHAFRGTPAAFQTCSPQPFVFWTLRWNGRPGYQRRSKGVPQLFFSPSLWQLFLLPFSDWARSFELKGGRVEEMQRIFWTNRNMFVGVWHWPLEIQVLDLYVFTLFETFMNFDWTMNITMSMIFKWTEVPTISRWKSPTT